MWMGAIETESLAFLRHPVNRIDCGPCDLRFTFLKRNPLFLNPQINCVYLVVKKIPGYFGRGTLHSASGELI